MQLDYVLNVVRYIIQKAPQILPTGETISTGELWFPGYEIHCFEKVILIKKDSAVWFKLLKQAVLKILILANAICLDKKYKTYSNPHWQP